MGTRLAALVLAAVFAVAIASPTQARPVQLQPCNGETRVLCGTVLAPLDPSGRHPGAIHLHVEVLRAQGLAPGAPPAKTIFLIAGGPGQGSADTFDLIDAGSDAQSVFPGYTLVAFDDRGTGKSDPLSCAGINGVLTATPLEAARIVGRCGRELGPTRVFYSTRNHADDVESVRRALGLGRIALFGVSYGTTEALAYAGAYPARVERLLLDSISPPARSDPFLLDSLRSVPHALASICRRGACRSVTRDAGADFRRLANKLAAHPLNGTVALPGAAPRHIRVDGARMLQLVVDTDLNSGIAAALPAAVSDALAGRPGPLERLAVLDEIWAEGGTLGINLPLNAATVCDDGPFPWSPYTPTTRRPTLIAAAVAALTPAQLALFGPWAAHMGVADECKEWPVPAGDPTPLEPRLPNVPVLILSGERDIRTPTLDARLVAAEFPRSRLLVVGGAGHSVLSFSACANEVVIGWLQGRKRGSCPRLPLELSPLTGFPRQAGTSALPPGKTLSAALATLHEAEAAWLTTLGSLRPIAGLAGGKLRPGSNFDGFELDDYADTPGLTLSGYIDYQPGSRDRWVGELYISGKRASSGRLALADGRLTGSLGSQRVSAPA